MFDDKAIKEITAEADRINKTNGFDKALEFLLKCWRGNVEIKDKMIDDLLKMLAIKSKEEYVSMVYDKGGM